MLTIILSQPQPAPGILPFYFYKKAGNNKLAVANTESPDV